MARPVTVAGCFAVAVSNSLVRVLLAPECVACGERLDRPLDSPACETCWRAVARLTNPCCVRCGDALPSFGAGDPICLRCRRHQPLVGMARSAGRYDGSLRHIIHAFKYERRRALARPLGHLMREAGREVLDGADALVPVPLSWRRSLVRGFNQADDLARHLKLPVWPLLRRTRHGPPQAGLPAAARHANVRGAYAIASWRSLRAIEGRVLVLVDDVMTTGATLDACAEPLVAAGAGAVRAITAARAVREPSH